MNQYKITVLKGDGIGPEIVDECIKVLNAAGEKFDFKIEYDYQLLGGCAIDETGVPFPKETEVACKASDAVLLGAVGGPKWDSQPGNNRPETAWIFSSFVSLQAVFISATGELMKKTELWVHMIQSAIPCPK